MPYFKTLTDFVRAQYATTTVYPPASKIFAAFDACPFDKVKVVILGQDPYHGPGQANGLCFSVNPGVPYPPSLINIFKEVSSDTGAAAPSDGDLSRWARQGVFMLNSVLTVEQGRAASHASRGWETLTDAAIAALSANREHLVFLLWGSYAINKGKLIDRSKHLVLTSVLPSRLTADFSATDIFRVRTNIFRLTVSRLYNGKTSGSHIIPVSGCIGMGERYHDRDF